MESKYDEEHSTYVKGWVLNGSNDAGRPCDEDILKTLKEDSKTKNLGE